MAEHVVSEPRVWCWWLLNDGLYRPCMAMFRTLFGVVDPIRLSPAWHDTVAFRCAASDSKVWLRSPIDFNGYCPHTLTRGSDPTLVTSKWVHGVWCHVSSTLVVGTFYVLLGTYVIMTDIDNKLDCCTLSIIEMNEAVICQPLLSELAEYR